MRFLTSISVATLLTFFTIITGCEKNSNTTVNFTIDLSQAQFSPLLSTGGYVVYDNIIIANIGSGNYIALSAYCTVDNDVLSFNYTYSYFVCPNNHEFNEQGGQINTPGAAPLISYHTLLSSNTYLQIYS